MSAVIKDEKVAGTYSLDVEKGIMLKGPVGSDKTSLMNLIRYLLPIDFRTVYTPAVKFHLNTAAMAIRPFIATPKVLFQQKDLIQSFMF